MPWKFQCLEGDGKWMDFDNEANRCINDTLRSRNLRTCIYLDLAISEYGEGVNPNPPVVNYTVWSENIQQLCAGDADELDYHDDYTSTNYTLDLKLMMRSQMNGTGTPCMVRGFWAEEGPFVEEEEEDEEEPLSGNRKVRGFWGEGEPFVWEEYLQYVDARRAFEAEMRSCQERAASSTRSSYNGHHAKAPPPVLGSQPGHHAKAPPPVLGSQSGQVSD